ncbi:MAG: PP2C family protein-serine/threonine phosphatase [Bryobacteraceae bacterium]
MNGPKPDARPRTRRGTAIELSWDMLSSAGGREENEGRCNFLALEQAACFVVADGLGGHGGGEIAAELAVDTVLQCFHESPRCSIEWLEESVQSANAAILERQSAEPALAKMRSTATVLVTDYESARWAHVGDSRVYHFRGGAVASQTSDHSVSQALADAGEITSEEIRFHEDRSRLRRCLGAQGQNRPTVLDVAVRLEPGDALLLCTDRF